MGSVVLLVSDALTAVVFGADVWRVDVGAAVVLGSVVLVGVDKLFIPGSGAAVFVVPNILVVLVLGAAVVVFAIAFPAGGVDPPVFPVPDILAPVCFGAAAGKELDKFPADLFKGLSVA